MAAHISRSVKTPSQTAITKGTDFIFPSAVKRAPIKIQKIIKDIIPIFFAIFDPLMKSITQKSEIVNGAF